MSAERSVSRRGFLRAAAGAPALAGAAGVAAAQQVEFGGWLEGVDGGFRDARGQSEVTVEVGAEGNGGTFAFSPAGLWISPGTTVTFEWVSNTHNVMVEAQPSGAGWEGHEAIENEGFSFSHTFETAGRYKYFCQPHLSMGMKGGIAVGGDVPTTGGGDGGGGDGGGHGGGGGGGGGDGGSGGIPDSAKTLGIASFIAMMATLVLSFLFLKYGGDATPPE